jgi:hypothetical protein
MDADRFDALSRALTTAPSRRTTLGALLAALLGSVLPGRSPDTRAAARKRNGRDVGAATHCLPPGAKPCKQGSQCCSGRCKKKKKKCLDCATGTTYCVSQEKCVDSAQFDTLCPDDGGPCTTNTDCCPSGGCTSGSSLYMTCSNGSCVCNVAHPDYPHACDWPPNPSQCHQCCNNDDCEVRFSDPNRVCLNGNCVCDGDTPTLCSQRIEGGKTYCTDTTSDPENCSAVVGNCGTKCAPDWACINGTCTFQSGG